MFHIPRLDMTWSLKKNAYGGLTTALLEDTSKLINTFIHLQTLPLSHTAFLVSALYVGVIGHPPQQSGRACASSQKHLARDCQSWPCGWQDTAHWMSEQAGERGSPQPLVSKSEFCKGVLSHLLKHSSPAISFLWRKLVPSNESLHIEHQYLSSVSSSFNWSSW